MSQPPPRVAAASWAPPDLDPYPERAEPRRSWLDRAEAVALRLPQAAAAALRLRLARRTLLAAAALEPGLRALDDAALSAEVAALHAMLRRRAPPGQAALAQGCAVLREVSRRTLGLRHHDVQLLGALALLDGRVAEMDTGEGKTVTAALAAALAALGGTPVHVVTVNDYLAARDAEELAPFYGALGLRVAAVGHGQDPAARAAAWRADIAYASNKELAFDHLRDRVALAGGAPGAARWKLRRLLDGGGALTSLRGLPFAIVDEADSVLVDEARTPLILSRQTDAAEERRRAEEALALADGLESGRDFRILADERRVILTEAGRTRLAALGEAMGGAWAGQVRREEAARQALSALHLFRRGDHYVVREGRVQIVDENTGRIQSDRAWSDGLHQIMEAKEALEVTPRRLSIARLTYQQLFRRYRRLAGMTGTAREARGEFWAVYRLGLARVPPNQPSRLNRAPAWVVATAAGKWRAVAARAAEVAAAGRPVLVGTRSVAASEAASAALAALGQPHRVLNAENDADEAAIIAQAGAAGRITVATNLAGRGVDIRLTPEVVAAGGLHVILTERHDSGRIDRQMEGRAARRGEPGGTEAILSLADPILELVPRHPLRRLALRGPFGQAAARALFDAAQRRTERVQARARRDLMEQERRLGDTLAFAGRGE